MKMNPMGVNGKVNKRRLPIYLLVIGVILYALSILMPWMTIGLGYIPGFEFNAYLLIILFIYPLYTFIRDVPIHQTYGLFCGVIPVGVLVVIYFMYTGKDAALDVALVRASFGFYTAFVGCILILAAIFMKLRMQNRLNTEKDE